MKIGFVGLGKMGLPIAVTIADKGHDVVGFDLDASRMTHDAQPYKEAGPDGTGDFNDSLADSKIRFGPIEEVVAHAEMLFVAVQTPHEDMYEGITRLPDERVDFDYSFLRLAVRNLVQLIEKPTILCVMSTVLPGTMKREIVPITDNNENVRLVYNPSFIAMGTTMRDFLVPEFVLVGVDNQSGADRMKSFYGTICECPVRTMSIASAELTKVTYNTYISMKIAFANTVMEICEHFTEADCEEVTDALKNARVRLISPAYMSGGMGDGGGCHPRDNIALSHLARKIGLSFDLFEAAMLCREKQARWLAKMLVDESRRNNLPVVILGGAFKPETNLDVGSPAYLVGNLVREFGVEPMIVDDQLETTPTEEEALAQPGVFLIGCRHGRYSSVTFAKKSLVIDPHRYVPDSLSGEYVVRRLGEGVKSSG
jgi:UDPglucose 6-dehydrogenase